MHRKPFSGHAVASRIDHEVLAFDEAEPSQFIEQRHLMRCIARARNQAAQTINAPGLLSTRRDRPRRCRAAEQRDESASLHSITLSRASMVIELLAEVPIAAGLGRIGPIPTH